MYTDTTVTIGVGTISDCAETKCQTVQIKLLQITALSQFNVLSLLFTLVHKLVRFLLDLQHSAKNNVPCMHASEISSNVSIQYMLKAR